MLHLLKKNLIPALLLSALFINGCSKTSEETEDVNAVLSTNEFVLKTISGNEYILKKKNGGFIIDAAEDKILIIDIFATWCPPCKAEATHLSSLAQKYKDSIVIMGVSIEDDITPEKLNDFRQQYNANYPLVHNGDTRRLINTVANSLHVGQSFGIPLMAMYKDGKLINYYQGAIEEEFIESDIKKALGKN